MQEERYIGDGVYASFDGYQIKLRTNREFGDHEIYLEPGAFMSLMRFGEQIWKIEKPENA